MPVGCCSLVVETPHPWWREPGF